MRRLLIVVAIVGLLIGVVVWRKGLAAARVRRYEDALVLVERGARFSVRGLGGVDLPTRGGMEPSFGNVAVTPDLTGGVTALSDRGDEIVRLVFQRPGRPDLPIAEAAFPLWKSALDGWKVRWTSANGESFLLSLKGQLSWVSLVTGKTSREVVSTGVRDFDFAGGWVWWLSAGTGMSLRGRQVQGAAERRFRLTFEPDRVIAAGPASLLLLRQAPGSPREGVLLDTSSGRSTPISAPAGLLGDRVALGADGLLLSTHINGGEHSDGSAKVGLIAWQPWRGRVIPLRNSGIDEIVEAAPSFVRRTGTNLP